MNMEIAALVCCGAYLLLGLGMRMALQLWRTGSTGFHGYGGAGRIETAAGLGCSFGTGTIGIGAPLMAMLDVAEPIGALEQPPIQALGLAIAVVGVAAMFYAQVAMGDSWRIGVEPEERTELVMDGPYALMRNPIYTAWLGTFAGITLMVPSWLAIFGAVVLLCSMELLVRRAEEPYLAQAHGAAFVSYAARVGRFVPGVGRLAAAERGHGDA
jgi:protein-S-isoprenylcysteine O-methyltransferase Ste14